jgi:glyoxylase-like metal-dependent hydrolase (beta-lactamase superfamily II)
MAVNSFTAKELFESMEKGENFIILDVRNQEDFEQAHAEGPGINEIINIPYFDFIEEVEVAVSKIPLGLDIKVICAKEKSSLFVADILAEKGRGGVGYLEGGYQMWSDLLVVKSLYQADYELWQFIRPAKGSCSYALGQDDEMFIFDPSRNVEFYQDFARKNSYTITRVFDTHLQADYISGGPHFEIEYVVHEDDFFVANFDYHPLEDGEIFTLKNGCKVHCVHSPGHTPGSTTFVIEDRWMISGDTVFIVSVGRPDLGGQIVEWSKQLYSTLKQRILPLPENLTVLPGHFSQWTKECAQDGSVSSRFGDVIKENEDIYTIDNIEDFVEFIKNNMHPQPLVYSQIRKVNAGILNPCENERMVMDVGKNQCAASTSRQ